MDTNQEPGKRRFWIAAAVTMALFLALAGWALAALGGSLLAFSPDEPASSTLEQQDTEVRPEASPSLEAETAPVLDAGPVSDDMLTRANETLETLSNTIVPIADPISITERLMGIEGIPEVLALSAAEIPIGTVETFWASNVDTDTYFQLDAELVASSEHVYFWVDQEVKVSRQAAMALVNVFEQDIYTTDRAFFGSEWRPGVDGDEHLFILFASGLGDSIAGYYSSSDEYSPLVHEYSNGHEMFYLNADNLGLRESFTFGVLAHEFQHMIHWNQDQNEDTWVDEGFAELAMLLNDFDVGGSDYAFTYDTDQTLARWPSEPGAAGAHYGQAFLFMTYFLDRFGSEATQLLVANQQNGLESVDETLVGLEETDPLSGELLTADHIFRDWAVALHMDDPSIGGGRYAFSSYHPVAPTPSDVISAPGVILREVSQYGIDYIQIEVPESYQLSFEGDRFARVVPVDPHGGDYMFYSNRGNESDMTLTRAFDLTEVDGVIELSYWTWFDIEEGWDYLYLEVSADNGQTWTILTTDGGTAYNPTGSSYGWGYTGYSGGGEEPTWIQETIDLSEFGGQQILVRFEYLTDASVNGEGLLLDDVRLDASGYESGFEDDQGGWEAAGFVRIYNLLPQTYRVIIVGEGVSPLVEEIELNEENRAELDISRMKNDHETIIILGTTRYTWQNASYRLEVSTP
ncbi:MAG: immune inhibitor A [Anaerolineales bacterium]|nr:immune inhibitor A [Anaerolineales bacterium]